MQLAGRRGCRWRFAATRSVADVQVVAMPGATDRPIGTANAADPNRRDKTVFDMEPVPFAQGIIECIRAGAQVVGGCCGTTPEHIRAVHQSMEDLQPELGSRH
jgi:methionine synthase I (cobalamin-dependent)